MCGIAGIIYRNSRRYPNLGRDLLKLIQPLESRGPDSCGVAFYRGQRKTALEIYKEVGLVANLDKTYGLSYFSGTHGIGHTRMATESAVDAKHCHPFTTGCDLAIVHNGQISNYYRLRYQLEQLDVVFETNNDSEILVHYIYVHLQQGKSLETTLERLIEDVDGSYTFIVSTRDQFGLVRDEMATKPAVIYESDEVIAIASEYRALINLPDFDLNATIREPDAGEINIWSTVAKKENHHNPLSKQIVSA